MTMTTSIDLAPYLTTIGVEVIRQVSDDELLCRCPAHRERLGKDDTHPSFYFNQTKLVGKCHSCQWDVGSLDYLVEYVTGSPATDDVVVEARKSSLTDGLRRLTERKREVILSDDPKYMEWALANKFTGVPTQLLELRRLKLDAVEHFGVRWDREKRCQILPIRSPRGALWGWQQRQQGGVYNYPREVKKSDTLFGFSIATADRVALVESPLDAVRLHQAGVPAVSSFGAAVSNRQVELLARHFTVVVVALDNDEAGREAASKILPKLRKRIGAIPWDYTGSRCKDPGDYTSDEELKATWRRTLRIGL